MSLLEAVRFAFRTILAQKLKSFFSLIGVLIGVTFLIAVVSVVQGMNRYMVDRFANALIGANTFELRQRPNILTDDVTEDVWREWRRRPAHQLRRRRLRAGPDPHPGHLRQVLLRPGERQLRRQGGQGRRSGGHRGELLPDPELRDHRRTDLHRPGSPRRHAGAGDRERAGRQADPGPRPHRARRSRSAGFPTASSAWSRSRAPCSGSRSTNSPSCRSTRPGGG